MKFKIFIAILITICAVSAMGFSVYAQEYGSTTAKITFRPGELILDEISSFSFGEQDIEAAEKDYPAVEDSIYLNVHDLRGSGQGWKITAMGGTFNSPANSLPGSLITLSGGVAVPTSPGNTPPAVTQNIELDMDETTSAEIAKAQSGTGLGNWSIEWNGSEGENTSVILTVPGGIGKIGTHTATITWTLANAP